MISLPTRDGRGSLPRGLARMSEDIKLARPETPDETNRRRVAMERIRRNELADHVGPQVPEPARGAAGDDMPLAVIGPGGSFTRAIHASPCTTDPDHGVRAAADRNAHATANASSRGDPEPETLRDGCCVVCGIELSLCTCE